MPLCPQGHPQPSADATAPFCPTCGSALINPCPVGHDNAAEARYCKECGRSMGRPTGTPTLATTALTAPVGATAGPGPAPAPARATPRSVGGRPSGTPTATSTPPGDDGGPGHPPRHGDRPRRGLLVAIVATAVAVLGVVIALVATSSGGSSPAAGSPTTGAADASPSTTEPATTSTSTTLSPQALPQGQALNALLAQSSGSRSQVGAATAAIASCGDLAGAQSTLTAAQASRQALVSQLGQLDVSALPNSAALTGALTTAWQSSAASDGSYAQWAADEQAKTCVPNDTSDASYQAALAADGRASTAKAQFASLWNPVATSLGLQQWQPDQL